MAGGCLTPRMIMARPYLWYSHLDQFFSAGDLDVAHGALRDWLWEQPQDALALLRD